MTDDQGNLTPLEQGFLATVRAIHDKQNAVDAMIGEATQAVIADMGTSDPDVVMPVLMQRVRERDDIAQALLDLEITRALRDCAIADGWQPVDETGDVWERTKDAS